MVAILREASEALLTLSSALRTLGVRGHPRVSCQIQSDIVAGIV